MFKNKTQMRERLQADYLLSERQAKNAVARLVRRYEFEEISALFANDPTGAVAVLRAHGFDVEPRYQQAKLVAS